MRAGLSEKGPKLVIRHSTNSLGRMDDAREQLGISFKLLEDEFSAEVAKLTSKRMTKPAWNRFLDHQAIAPLVDEKGEPKTKAALTRAENKREILNGLWNEDERVAPWRGTAWGAVQVINTYDHHLKTVRDTSGRKRDVADIRAERNAAEMVGGGFDKLDAETAKIALEVIS
jgi:hypothetical protein